MELGSVIIPIFTDGETKTQWRYKYGYTENF